MARVFTISRRRFLAQGAAALAWAARPAAAQAIPAVEASGTPLSMEATAKLAALPGKALLGAAGRTPLVTELVDYNAPQWRRSALDMRELIAGDAALSYAVIQTPRGNLGSLEAARVSLAVLAKGVGPFEGFYMALAEGKGAVDGPAALDAARSVGLDRFVVFNGSIVPENTQALSQAAAFASAAGVLDTPAYVIGGKIYLGYLDLAAKRALIAAARG